MPSCKIIKTRGHFPTDDAANKLIWLALRNITAEWGKAARHWKEAMNQFAILYDDRFNAGPHRADQCRTPGPLPRQAAGACLSDRRQTPRGGEAAKPGEALE